MKNNKQTRVGLQLKAVLILALVVIGTTLSGGWFYFVTTQSWLAGYDRRQAVRLAESLGLAAQHDLLGRQSNSLQRLVGDFIQNDNVRYVSLIDADGRVVATAARDNEGNRWGGLGAWSVSVSSAEEAGGNSMVVARPIVIRRAGLPDQLVGAVRLVLDTTATASSLVKVTHRMSAIAAAIVICALPLGYLLVWRVIVQPVRRLLQASRRLAGGDFTARTGLRSNDEIGELAIAFDVMASQIARSRDELVVANEHLESEVAQRTGELASANRRLREEIQEKEDFLRAVSHDLNAPLRNIAGIATMILTKHHDKLDEEIVSRLERIRANADIETSLINELLELSRVKSCPQERQMTDMKQLVNGVAETLDYELKNRNIALELRGPMPHLYVEPSRIRQVFQNFIDNAIKYMHRPTGGRIEIGYRFIDDEHQFSVTDNGPGIPADELQKVFYVFHRAKNSMVSNVSGKGVGLALVRTIATNYEGRAWVQSELGQGSTFFFTMGAHCTKGPQAKEAVQSAATPATAGAAQG